jgi:hypothetical protein
MALGNLWFLLSVFVTLAVNQAQELPQKLYLAVSIAQNLCIFTSQILSFKAENSVSYLSNFLYLDN